MDQDFIEENQANLNNNLIEERKKAILAGSPESIRNVILPCITAEQKYVPHWYVYDTLGSKLFDDVAMKNPHYHLYWAETSIIKQYAGEIVNLLGPDTVVSELGAGSSKKTVYILEGLLKQRKNVEFIPIDIAKDFIEENAKSMRKKYENLIVEPFAGDFSDGLRHLNSCSKQFVLLFLGSSFSNIPLNDMIPFLKNVKNCMKDNDYFLVGIDLVQNVEKIRKAYTHLPTCAPYRKNVLTRLNRDFDSDFDLDDFGVHFNYVISEEKNVFSCPQYVQVGLQCLKDQTIHLKTVGKDIAMKKGEILYVHEPGNLSIKWNWSQFTELAEKAGFLLEKKWTDKNHSFGLACLKIKLPKITNKLV